MRLSLYSDYALRLLMRLALEEGRLVTILEVSEAYRISANHLMKIAHQLGREGYIETVRGRNGGLRLARAPEEINVGELVRRTEEGFDLVECFDRKTNRCVITDVCRLRGLLDEALEAFLGVLDGHTLADLVSDNPALKRRLAPTDV